MDKPLIVSTLEIVNNTLEGVYSVAYTKGYSRRMSDEKLFRDRRTSHFEDDWKKELTVIDDLIHPLKIKSTKQCFIREYMQENVILCKIIEETFGK